MNPGEDRHPETSPVAATGRGRHGQFWETGWQAIRGLLMLCAVILAALMGFLAVEAVRALF
jgi:hypothetical protein